MRAANKSPVVTLLLFLTIYHASFILTCVSSFVVPHSPTTTSTTTTTSYSTTTARRRTTPRESHDTNKKRHHHNEITSTTTSLHASLAAPVGGIFKKASTIFPPVIRNALFVSFAILLVAQRQRIFYPNSSPDSSHAEPLPPGKFDGCPFLGSLTMYGAVNGYISKRAAKLGLNDKIPNIWKFFGMGSPMAVVSGSDTVREVFSREFKKEQSIRVPESFGNPNYVGLMFGTESLSFEAKDPKKYRFLREIVGQALTPSAVAKGIPALQRAAEVAVDRITSTPQTAVKNIMFKLTLDVAWRQIIGLELKDDDALEQFYKDVSVWMKALVSYINYVLPTPAFIIKRTKSYKCKIAVQRLIEDKIDCLQKNGPDGSTVGAMMFGKDPENPEKTLTRQQVIDNTFFLLAAGSETSSMTLTNALLLLGMHPHAWDKLVREQKNLVSTHGEKLTQDVLEKEKSPYLDAVIKETMRLFTLSGGQIRLVDDGTVVVDGIQIPKKWMVMCSLSLTHERDPKTSLPDGSHMTIERGFKPERWLEAESRPTTEYMPWGAGYRFCPGSHLAMAEMKTFLSIMARKVKSYDLVTDVENLKWEEGVILTPKDGVVIRPHKM